MSDSDPYSDTSMVAIDQSSPREMTPEEKLGLHRLAWRHQIVEAIESADDTGQDDVLAIAHRAVELAELNGLLDPAKTLYASEHQ